MTCIAFKKGQRNVDFSTLHFLNLPIIRGNLTRALAVFKSISLPKGG